MSFSHHPRRRWEPTKWFRSWQTRGVNPPTQEQLLRRNELQAFRLVLAGKEPPRD